MTLGDALNKPLPEALRPDQPAAKPFSGAGPTATPVLNPLALQALIEHAGRSAAARFADDFLKLFEDRLTHMDAALTKADPVSALNAVLSLKASAAMLGAEQMTLYCAGLEVELRGHRIPLAGALPRLAADFTSALAGAIADTFPNEAKGPAPAP
ncbi:MAG TPA: Hpt domain-containing protein [Arthrobacter sp.]|nr:Hpt domain-containing protein [Arthrobacter sp.]